MTAIRKFLNTNACKNFMASLISICLGVFVGFLVLFFSNRSQAFAGIGTIFSSAFKDMKNLGQVFYVATPIIMTGLSVGFANQTGLFNIGASGQYLVGSFVAIFVTHQMKQWPGFLVCMIAIIMAGLAGAIWGGISGFLKAKFNVNEVITCIMLNYISVYFVNLSIKNTIYDFLQNQTLPVPADRNIPKLGLDKIFRTQSSVSVVNASIFLAILIAICIWVILNKTKFGYELKACGFNPYASRYAGINESKNIILSMCIAGMLAGFGGAFIHLSGSGKAIEVMDAVPVEGFNGIPVALLGMNHPIGIIFSGLFISYLNIGGFNMQRLNFAPQIIDIMISVIIYFSAFSLMFKTWIEKYLRKIAKKGVEK